MCGIPCRSVLLPSLCLLLSATSVFAQTGTIAGRITGSGTGWPVVGALVEVRGPGNARSQRVATNQEGTFRISGLAPGSYVVSVAAMGYGTQAADTVQVTPSATAALSMSLEPAPIELNPLTSLDRARW